MAHWQPCTLSEWLTDWLSWVLIKCDNDEPGSLPVCVEACLGRPSLQASRYCTSHFQLCHWEDGGNWSELLRWRRAEFQLLHSWGNTGLFLNSAVTQKHSTCWNNVGRAPVFSSMSLLFSLEAQSSLWQCYRDILFLCLDPCTHWFQKGEVVGRRREDCTKQINNVMSPSHRNFILAAPLLL